MFIPWFSQAGNAIESSRLGTSAIANGKNDDVIQLFLLVFLKSRLWICNKTPADDPEPQQIGYVNLVPRCTENEFEDFRETIERLNASIEYQPIQG